MEFLGIGPLELIAILLIILVVMGPNDIVKMASTLGKSLRNLRRSEMWTAMQRAQREIRSLPDTLARQVDLDDLKDIKKQIEGDLAEQKEEVEAFDREFVAWTRRGEKKDEAAAEEKEAPEEKPKANNEEDKQ